MSPLLPGRSPVVGGLLLVVMMGGLTFAQQSGVAAGVGDADSAKGFNGEKSNWRGFDRFDFVMDADNLSITPTVASADDGTGILARTEGQVRCVVVVPQKEAPGNPWSWRGRYFDHEPQCEVELLKRGYHIGFVQSDEMRHWEAWFDFLTKWHGFSTRPALVGMSGGGRNAFNWATLHPDRVSCIYADNPLITPEALRRLDSLAERDIPLLHVCGSLEPLSLHHTFPIEAIYRQLGGRISVMIKDGVGHHPHSLKDPQPIVEFVTDSMQPPAAAPKFVTGEVRRDNFYSSGSRYVTFPSEEWHITCRGSRFSPTYSRYEFGADGMTGIVHVIAPKKPAPGTPWVFRPDIVSPQDRVDLALLERGFHIVTAPRPRNTGVTLLEEWRTIYDHLVAHGFSETPVLKGSAGAAAEAYAWAIAHPDKVCCIYGENPILRHYDSETQPLDDLSKLAEAKTPILHVSGSEDPWLDSQTRVVEHRYRELGGTITVIVEEGKGHTRLAPNAPEPVLSFVLKATTGRRNPSSP